MSDSLQPYGKSSSFQGIVLCSGDSPGKNTRVGCHFLLQGIFLIHGSNLHLLYLLHWQTQIEPVSLMSFLPQVPPGKPYIYLLFFQFSSHLGYYGVLCRVPCAIYSKSWLIIYFIYSVYMLIPISQFILPFTFPFW